MDNPKQQVIDRLKQATNVLVTVSNNPSVDQLAACIGLALMLNKLGKHGTAVFSGEVPSTMEFLQPEKTIEKNTDSLRDFIIALDKSKADKLRYKVEDRVVKIFITPYRTTLSEKDLEFSQGDFNVDVVVGIGVHQQSELDQAITTHGRILHDATVISINNSPNGNLGNINWLDTTVSSLCEMIVLIGEELGQNIFDNQIATALLTGIVAATNRFSNDKTSPQTMSASAKLMEAGANQQLVATQLDIQSNPPPAAPTTSPDQPPPPSGTPPVQPPPADNGTLEVSHDQPTSEPQTTQQQLDQINIDSEGQFHSFEPRAELSPSEENPDKAAAAASMIPSDNNQLTSAAGAPINTSNTQAMNNLFAASSLDTLSTPAPTPPSTEPMPQLNLPPVEVTPPTLTPPVEAVAPPPPVASPPADETLQQLETAVNSPHLNQIAPEPAPSAPEPPAQLDSTGSNMPNIEAARNAVKAAVNSQPPPNMDRLQGLGTTTAFNDIQGMQTSGMPASPDNSQQPASEPAISGIKVYSDTENAANGLATPPLSPDMPQPTLTFPLPNRPMASPPSNNFDQPASSPPPPPVPPPMTYMPPTMYQPGSESGPQPDLPL